jgi:hypothetical protein
MITVWLRYDYGMITVWLRYDYGMITVWLQIFFMYSLFYPKNEGMCFVPNVSSFLPHYSAWNKGEAVITQIYCCFFESEYNTTQIFEKASAVATQETSLGVRVCNRGSGSIILISEEDICLDEMLGCNTARSYTGLRMFEINLLTEHKGSMSNEIMKLWVHLYQIQWR